MVLDFYPKGFGREPCDKKVSFTILMLKVIQLKNEVLKMSFTYCYMPGNLLLVIGTKHGFMQINHNKPSL